MRPYWLVILVLIACAQAPQQAVVAPPTPVVFSECHAVRSVGEQCTQDCECLQPAVCVSGSCGLLKKGEGEGCVENRQCLSGYCTQSHTCGGPDERTTYDCRKQCKDYIDGKPSESCYTVCSYQYSDTKPTYVT